MHVREDRAGERRLWRNHSCQCQGPTAGAAVGGASTACCTLRRGVQLPSAPRISRTLSVCVVNGVTCLFGSDPPLFFYLLCFSASL